MTVTRYLPKATYGRKVWCRLRVQQEMHGSRNVRGWYSVYNQVEQAKHWALAGLFFLFVFYPILVSDARPWLSLILG